MGQRRREPAPNLDDASIGKREGAILESGLDNSPMYDDVTYDSDSASIGICRRGTDEPLHRGLRRAGENRCASLENRPKRRNSLSAASVIAPRWPHLWDDKIGMFLNKDLHTGQSSLRLSPTNFYPLLAKAATPEQARRMINEHLLNSAEFWGKWVIPSIARNDPAFPGSEILARKNLGTIELSGLSRPPQLRRSDDLQRVRAEVLRPIPAGVESKQARTRELQRDYGHGR